MKKQILLKIYGRVQMVLYRDSTRRMARKLGLVGWVRNEKDKTVTVLAEGEEERLKELIDWCRTGPVLARVDEIEIDWRKANNQFDKFEIKY